MTTQESEVNKNILLMSNIVGASEIVTMPSTDLASNTFTQPNGALRSPQWPLNYPVSITSYTVFSAIPGVYRTITGTIATEASWDHVRILDGSGLTGTVLWDTTSANTGVAYPVSFTSGVNHTFTVAFRSDGSGQSSGFSLAVRGFQSNPPTDVGEINADMGIPQAKDSLGSFLLRQANLGNADVQVFTSSGTWTKPANASAVRIFMIGAGGGGGSGRRGATSTVRCGGSGGSGGATISYITVPASAFAATESVTVAAGGVGGAAQTANDSNGNAGATGGNTDFSSGSSLIRALGGNGGAAGTNTASTAAAGVIGDHSTSGTGGSVISTSATVAGTSTTGWLTTGGGAGGGMTSGNAVNSGASAATQTTVTLFNSIQNSGTTSVTPTPGSVQIGQSGLGGFGYYTRPKGGTGGGGGSPNTTFTVSGAGGTGGLYGGGGGGGAGSLNGVNSGAGGDGGPGIVVIISW